MTEHWTKLRVRKGGICQPGRALTRVRASRGCLTSACRRWSTPSEASQPTELCGKACTRWRRRRLDKADHRGGPDLSSGTDGRATGPNRALARRG